MRVGSSGILSPGDQARSACELVLFVSSPGPDGRPPLPIYTYRCQACENVLEKRQSFSEDPLTTCQQCGGELRKVLHPVGIVFKGSGFYNTDYRGSNGAATKDGSDKDSSEKDPSEKAESKSKDSEASTAAADTSKTSGSGSKSEGEKPAATKAASSGSGATKATASAGSARSE